MTRITVVGGGLAGLVASVACAEEGAEVELHEAHSTLGGRARTTDGPFAAHEGPHVFYADAPFWPWLVERDLLGPVARVSLTDLRATRFRRDGRLRGLPPAGLVRMLAARRRRAPVDQDFSGWAAGLWGEAAARAAANFIGVVTYDHDPGRLSAAFVWNLILRTTAPRAPAVRYVRGGWPSVIDRLAARARRLGVRIATGSRVDALPTGPVIVATQLESARTLLGDASLSWTSGRCVLLDVGVRADPRDVFLVSDLDAAGFAVRPSSPDPSCAPPGHSLVQSCMPIRPGEPRAAARTRLEDVLDLGLPGWRDRTTWRRDAVADGRSGALDLPGTTWRDRPAVDRGDGVFLAGDLVAAPGMRGEVAVNSALRAARAALESAGLPAPDTAGV